MNNNDDALTAMINTMDRALAYGVNETNNIAFAAYDHTAIDHSEGTVWLGDDRLVRIDRIRLLTDPGCPVYDISYCYGTLRDGRHVRVDLGTHQIPRARKGASLKYQLIQLARAAGVNAKTLGMLDDSTISLLR